MTKYFLKASGSARILELADKTQAVDFYQWILSVGSPEHFSIMRDAVTLVNVNWDGTFDPEVLSWLKSQAYIAESKGYPVDAAYHGKYYDIERIKILLTAQNYHNERKAQHARAGVMERWQEADAHLRSGWAQILRLIDGAQVKKYEDRLKVFFTGSNNPYLTLYPETKTGEFV